MSEVGKVSAQIVDMEVQAKTYGWDSRYGRMHVQLNVKKARLRYVCGMLLRNFFFSFFFFFPLPPRRFPALSLCLP